MRRCLTLGVALFTRACKEAKNPAVKAFAAKTPPTLQKYPAMAQNPEK